MSGVVILNKLHKKPADTILTVQVLNNATERVSMGSNEDLLACLHLGHNGVIPVGQSALNGPVQ